MLLSTEHFNKVLSLIMLRSVIPACLSMNEGRANGDQSDCEELGACLPRCPVHGSVLNG